MTPLRTRRWPFVVAFFGGLALLAALLPLYDAALPRGLSITRGKAREIADAEAVKWGIPVDKSFVVTVWEDSDILEKELASDPARRRSADADPAVGPRLGGYKVVYFRNGVEKFPEYGTVVVGIHGEVLWARRMARAEETGAAPAAESLRATADAFVASRDFPGAPSLVFESVRPTVLRTRTDHVFRYRVSSTFPTGDVGFYLGVYFIGDKLSGWTLIEEYKDGRRFLPETGANVVATFLRYGELFGLLLVLLIVFLRKYHAGEVGVGTSSAVFGAVLGLGILFTALVAKWSGLGSTLGAIDARQNTFAIGGFKFLFYDIPLAVLVFLAWSVGESIARERWGDRLASFDALLRRDPVNATVGGALANGLLAGPALAAAALLPPLVPLLLGKVHGIPGSCAAMVLNSSGGPGTVIAAAALDATVFESVGLLFLLGFFHRRGLLGLGVVLAAAFGMMMSIAPAPVAPFSWEVALGFGGALACVAVFLASDLLAAGTALFAGTLMLAFLPLLRVVSGPPRTGLLAALLVPLAALAALAAAGIATKRRVAYSHADLAPHVKRIVERERIKAEIDAANRIQSALLPSAEPEFAGTTVASHYRAATEIGGDYFDFLPLPEGRLGIAFGDVSGHGLTSGIVMAMAKAALLVQTGYDSSPARVLEVLNEMLRRTAPKRILMTFFFGILDADAGLLRFASAGHLDPYVFRARERRLEALSAWGFPLGVKRREPFRERTVSFQPGDRLILYSDGLIEAVDDDGEPFGFDRFEEVLLRHGGAGAGELRDALLKSIRGFTRNRPPEDDQTLVIVSFGEDDVASLRRAG